MPAGATLAFSAAATGGSALLKGSAAGQATKAAKQAQQANLAFANGVYGDAQSNLNPTIQGGLKAGNALQGLLGIGGDPAASQKAWDTYRNSTNYQFQFDQGTQAVKTANAPSFNSGATAKALINYGQGQAGSALAGYEGLLGGQQTLGANAAGTLAGVGTDISKQVADTNNNTAGVKGTSALYGANTGGSALQGLTSLANSALTGSSFGGGGSSGGLSGLKGLY